ncbi:GDP-mannose 4,6-dehydratase [Immundisolibacter sp.]|uniref:GDP-mannose 4,6-dehydratase n=1 Tax=Immundisolibacter sp. TaxID=1934948 RepID=UPI0035683D1C
MRCALIVGHTGQDGRFLWDQLVQSGVSVIGISRRGSSVHNVKWDKNTDISDLASVTRLMRYLKPESIFFLAAHHHSSQENVENEGDIVTTSLTVHVNAFNHFLLCARLFCPQSRIFYASSSRVFGESAISPQNENTELKPNCIYGITKMMGMLLADYYRRVYRMYVSCGILYNHESPLRGEKFLSRRAIDGLVAIKYGHATSLEVGDLDARVDWGYAPDYTRAMQLVLEADSPGDFVIATGKTHSVRELIMIAASHLGIQWEKYVTEQSSILHRNAQELCGDSSRLREVTGWTPSMDFSTMIKLLVNASEKKFQGNR